MEFVGFNAKTFHNFFATVDVKSDSSDWYFSGKIILRRNNLKEIKRSKKGSGVTLLKKINEYNDGINCYIPSDGYCFVKCLNYVLNKDYTKEFQDFINSFSKSNRKGVMTTARICEFNKKFNTNFQIYMPKHRHFQPKKVSEELDWVFYLHKSHFCLIKRNNKTLGIKEIEDNYDENVWRTCRDDNAETGFCSDVLTLVDIQEIVKASGRIIRILDGIVYEENFKTPPYRDYILILRDLRNKYKREGNIVGSNCMKLLGNSLYGKSIQKDITTSRHLWSEATLKTNFDSHVKSFPKVNETQYIVEINEEEKELDCTPPKSTRLTPSHLGSFVLSHSKKIACQAR
ncbi:hypothetical protein LOTGIDRAFT_162615 [Lottia gigantea]|uniref:DNA-directed DNA polymerase n=1 Tax=Lottia gigantea TaxID=225164 RepID=V4A6F4_LOTGI|nr:hypothetical protein LOTGIDRAFT_162615 [Lottia gigantea]ESO92312.1 hypothetical protein LOTGIDRAFT_162615 [Lottia gigantea]